MTNTNITSNTKTLKLTTLIKFDNKIYEEVSIRSPKVADLKLLDQAGGEIEKSITLTASLTGIPELALEEISAFDWKNIQEVIAGFLSAAPQITKK